LIDRVKGEKYQREGESGKKKNREGLCRREKEFILASAPKGGGRGRNRRSERESLDLVKVLLQRTKSELKRGGKVGVARGR